MRMHALVVIAALATGLFGCAKKKKSADTKPIGTAATAGAATGAAPATTSQDAPADLPAFLDRFCAAVASGDKAYVTAHVDPSFTSEQATDPTTCGGRTGKRCFRRLGGQHAEPDFAPVCARIKAVPRATTASFASSRRARRPPRHAASDPSRSGFRPRSMAMGCPRGHSLGDARFREDT